MSEFNNDNISNYSWVPDKNANGKIEIGGYSGAYSAPAHPYTYQAPKKSGRVGFAIAVVALCVILSGITAFGGTYLANKFFAPTPEKNVSDGVDTAEPVETKEVVSTNGEPGSITVNKVESAGEVRNPDEVSLTASVAAKVKDAVVEITTETVVSGSRFSQYITSGAGSGVIFAKEGYIITNNHVIEGADNITVRTTDGTEYKATLIGTDSTADIAVIKIDAGDKTLTTATIGDSDRLIVGEPVVAIGNPLGELGGSVTNGIISALDRDILIDGERMTLLQHNAAVNPGNSGGGLFNAKGELIGIVNAKSTGEDVEGIGFAIPVNNAYNVVEQLLEYGYVRGRAYLGLDLIDIQNTFDAMYYRVNTFGVYVLESEFIEELRPGDRISALDGEEVNSYSDLKSLLSKKSIGDEVTISVVRNGRVIDIKAVCREYAPSQSTVDFGS